MSVNGYLTRISGSAVLNGKEKQDIQTSVQYILNNLNSYFSGQVSEMKLFGSFSRGTILPRNRDVRSDVDLMIIFKDGSKEPQTYLSWLKGFVARYYRASEHKQSHPAIRLELNHIMFELVPAVTNFLGQCYIPDKASSWSSWQLPTLQALIGH